MRERGVKLWSPWADWAQWDKRQLPELPNLPAERLPVRP
jgi:hypothetical protein